MNIKFKQFGENITFEIINLKGQVIFKTKEIKAIDISNLEKGVYFLNLESTGQNTSLTKFIKK